jgi:hypothetical protein
MHQRSPLLAWACAGLLTATAAFGQIYKTTDAQGNVLFTDQPPPSAADAEKVDLNRLNTAPPPKPAPPSGEPSADIKPAKAKQPRALEYQIAIQSPADESTIPMGPGNFSVVAATDPPLAAGERLQLLFDGEPRGDAQASASWQLTNVFRGAHELRVQRETAEGEVLATSKPVTVYVHRPSVKFSNSNFNSNRAANIAN